MNERLKQAGYHEQEGCETCAHVFVNGHPLKRAACS